ncbi:DUF3667 domain-containing protein [Winogradskyella poriferorum]|uniref:DUF3667 domain-containing protein n=1 Tax=Winogradskyella poriferorum TaxID=307627 RepID=UPI003D65F32C
MKCKNCETSIKQNQKFCDNCGARIIKNRLTPTVLAKQVNEQFLSIDNKLLITFIDLFKCPEQVINGYINGTRKKYIDVLQYFALALTLVGVQVFLMNSFFKSELESTFESLRAFESATGGAKNPINSTINSQFESFEEINNYQSVFYILSIPLYAFGSWATNFLIKPVYKYNFTEHLVVNIYYYAQVIIITAVLYILFLFLGLDYLVISGVVTVLIFIYHFYTLKRVFQLDFWNGVAFYLLVMVAFGIIGAIIGILILIAGFLYGYFGAIK